MSRQMRYNLSRQSEVGCRLQGIHGRIVMVVEMTNTDWNPVSMHEKDE